MKLRKNTAGRWIKPDGTWASKAEIGNRNRTRKPRKRSAPAKPQKKQYRTPTNWNPPKPKRPAWNKELKRYDLSIRIDRVEGPQEIAEQYTLTLWAELFEYEPDRFRICKFTMKRTFFWIDSEDEPDTFDDNIYGDDEEEQSFDPEEFGWTLITEKVEVTEAKEAGAPTRQDPSPKRQPATKTEEKLYGKTIKVDPRDLAELVEAIYNEIYQDTPLNLHDAIIFTTAYLLQDRISKSDPDMEISDPDDDEEVPF